MVLEETNTLVPHDSGRGKEQRKLSYSVLSAYGVLMFLSDVKSTEKSVLLPLY
jgi:hypothetical protein